MHKSVHDIAKYLASPPVAEVSWPVTICLAAVIILQVITPIDSAFPFLPFSFLRSASWLCFGCARGNHQFCKKRFGGAVSNASEVSQSTHLLPRPLPIAFSSANIPLGPMSRLFPTFGGRTKAAPPPTTTTSAGEVRMGDTVVQLSCSKATTAAGGVNEHEGTAGSSSTGVSERGNLFVYTSTLKALGTAGSPV